MYKIGRTQIYLILLAALALQAGPLGYVRISGARPDILLACVVFFGLFLGPAAGFESGLAAGLLKDIFALDFFWINALILGVTGLFAGGVSAKFFKESKRTELLIVTVFNAFAMSIHFLIVSILPGPLALEFGEFFLSSVIPASIYTGVLSVPVYRWLISFYNLKETEDYL